MYKPPDSILAVWGVFLGAAVALIYGGQLYVMNGQLGVMQGQLSAQHLDQRAWMQIWFNAAPLKADSADVGKLRALNVGKIPAREIKGIIAVQTSEKDVPPVLGYNGPTTRFSSNIEFPTTQSDATYDMPIARMRRVQIAGNTQDIPHPFLQSEIDRFTNGEIFIVVYARIEYKDSSGEHWTQFCIPLSAGKGEIIQSKGCVDYNDADKK